MKAEAKTKSESANVNVRVSQYKARVGSFLASRRGKMFGIAEVAALFGSCLILGLVMLSYLYFVVPARMRVTSLTTEKKQTQTNLETLQGVVNTEQNTTQTVQQITASLDNFEKGFLPPEDVGRMELYEELNQLIIKNGLRNTSGPTYTTLEPEGTKTAGGKNIATRWQSFYPGVAVMVTVEGQYENVRRFIRDVERSKQFVVINEVELQRARDTNSPVAVEGEAAAAAAEQPAPAAGSGTRGSPVSLQLSMATYFQRNTAGTAPVTQE
jgi:Tfp pilus assembly protein PilO